MSRSLEASTVPTLMRICDVHDVPLATNPVTARLMVRADRLR